MMSSWISFGDIPFLQRYFMTAQLQLSIFCQFDKPFSSLQPFPTVFKSFHISYSLYQKTSIRLNYQLIGILYQFIESKYNGPRIFDHTSYNCKLYSSSLQKSELVSAILIGHTQMIILLLKGCKHQQPRSLSKSYNWYRTKSFSFDQQAFIINKSLSLSLSYIYI